MRLIDLRVRPLRWANNPEGFARPGWPGWPVRMKVATCRILTAIDFDWDRCWDSMSMKTTAFVSLGVYGAHN